MVLGEGRERVCGRGNFMRCEDRQLLRNEPNCLESRHPSALLWVITKLHEITQEWLSNQLNPECIVLVFFILVRFIPASNRLTPHQRLELVSAGIDHGVASTHLVGYTSPTRPPTRQKQTITLPMSTLTCKG